MTLSNKVPLTTWHLRVGVMGGLASGYDPRSDHGWILLGGPSLRFVGKHLGATATLYAQEALTVNVDIPLRTYWTRIHTGRW